MLWKGCWHIDKKRILLTGANGRIGSEVLKSFRNTENYDIIAIDRKPNDQEKIMEVDVCDYESVCQVMEGIDTVIHLAWYLGKDQFKETILPVNIEGTYHVYEAARMYGVKRIIFGSSTHVTGYYKNDERVTPESPYRPDSLYGLGKCYGELIGRMYADKYDISSIQVRIGNYNKRSKPRTIHNSRMWISQRDCAELFRCCVEADEKIRYLALYGVSANQDNLWDIGYLQDLIGYRPLDNSCMFAEELVYEHDETGYQGGEFINL